MSVRTGRLVAIFSFSALVQPYWSKALTRGEKESTRGTPASFGVETIRAFPHEGSPFTQGLEISNDGRHLVETSGSYPPGTNSYVRLVDPATGKTVKSLQQGLEGRFAEGIVQAQNGHYFMSTYVDKKFVEYSPELEYIGETSYPMMGWGLTRTIDGSSFLATNGSEFVTTLQKDTLEVIEDKVVTCMGKKVKELNELEMVENFNGLGPTLLANLYRSRLVLAVNPATGECTGVFSLDGLGNGNAAQFNEIQGFHVANGLAYNKTSGTLFATGKNWDQMFEVRVRPDPQGMALTLLSNFLMSAPPAAQGGAMLWQVSPNAGAGDQHSFLEAQAKRMPAAGGVPLPPN